MGLQKQINLRLDSTDNETLKTIAEAQGRSEQEILRLSFRKYAKEFQEQMAFLQSVERGWVELRSGVSEIVTNDDSFIDEILKEINDESTSS